MSRVLVIACLLAGCGRSSRPPAPRVPRPLGTGEVVGVVHGKPGLLLPTVTVIVELPDRTIDTIDDADGRFVLHDVPAGTHVLNIYCGDQVVQRKIVVQPSTRTELSVTIDQTKPGPPETIQRAATPG